MHSHIDWEDISCSRWKIFMKMTEYIKLVNKFLRLFSYRDPRSRSYVDIFCYAYLCMKKKMSSCVFTVFIFMIIVEIIYYIHNLNPKLCSILCLSKSSLYAFFCKKNVYCVCKSYKTKHCRESISIYKPFFCKEIILKKAALFNFKPDPCIHVPCHDIHYIWQLIIFKIINAIRFFCDPTKYQTA